jgi:2-polyprenyl-6-hydroxyphenyl methylase/3-demethylubiquinone-9 3-methyltransferase
MTGTADPGNVALFGHLAADWWDPDGSSRLLHRINPVRLAYLRDQVTRHASRDARQRHLLSGIRVLDVGCGGGLVAEPLARMGADVTAIDSGEAQIAVAREHAAAQGLAIDYRAIEVTELADASPGCFDLVTCFEVIEHVTDVPAFLAALHRLLKTGGLLLFSTPNRTAASWAVLIAGAERIARLIPRGGHDWNRFLTPGELTAALAAAGFDVRQTDGLSWSPMRGFHISRDLSVNYIGAAVAR